MFKDCWGYGAVSSSYLSQSNLRRQKQQRHMKNGNGGDDVHYMSF